MIGRNAPFSRSSTIKGGPEKHAEDSFGNQHLSAIELLRGLAASLVVFTHYYPLLDPDPGVWKLASTGVNLFFVLSGFVFAPYLLGKPLPYLPHIVRRLFRMYPLYLVALITYVGLRASSGQPWAYAADHLLMAHTLQNQEIAFYYNPAFWSLPPEFEFYLFLPLLAYFGRRVGLGPFILIALAMRIGIGMFAAAYPNPAHPILIANVHLPGVLIEFLVGALAYQHASASAPPRQRNTQLALLAALVLFLALLLIEHHHLTNSGGQAPLWLGAQVGLVAAIAYAGVVTWVVVTLRLDRHARLAVFSEWAGRLSYSVYLFHNAALQVSQRMLPSATQLVVLLVALLLTLFAAWILHIGLEAPARHLGRKLSLRLSSRTATNQNQPKATANSP